MSIHICKMLEFYKRFHGQSRKETNNNRIVTKTTKSIQPAAGKLLQNYEPNKMKSRKLRMKTDISKSNHEK
ncbi:hypothetical protein TetV_010 [Tetraselmis virus 1]|uniref:Uncharacterized protein n=1 Tax=Tetraselmis virus 1 TaxID=2060617 RepID=A0A2P0VMI4_9VIRU|nr:hypothetical protein QJ968_gp010 [Tetraselmis virus 1]AUF82102.1 hypothetical protein TetV_010 [Tetraselmis virus 1]